MQAADEAEHVFEPASPLGEVGPEKHRRMQQVEIGQGTVEIVEGSPPDDGRRFTRVAALLN
jgi:hypothetical protein